MLCPFGRISGIFIMRDRSMPGGTELIGQQQENKSNLSNRSSGVQISRDID